VSEARTLVLGVIAGITILLGLPIGRMRRPMPRVRQFLNAVAIGILVFLIWDVVTNAFDPISSSLSALHDHRGGVWPVVGYAALFFGGLGAGLVTLVYYEQFLAARRPHPPGVGATLDTEVAARGMPVAKLSDQARLALFIAAGIGLHNFGEGLAIGASAARNELALATLLVIGFALHNATEGFGIVAPLAAEEVRPSWGFLLLLGLIGGGPTFVGTAVGRQFTSTPVDVVFLSLAAGSILYVVIQLLGVANRARRPVLVAWGVLIGLTAGFVTDMIVTAAGA